MGVIAVQKGTCPISVKSERLLAFVLPSCWTRVFKRWLESWNLISYLCFVRVTGPMNDCGNVRATQMGTSVQYFRKSVLRDLQAAAAESFVRVAKLTEVDI